MAINTDTISEVGTTTPYSWTGGEGAAIGTGFSGAIVELEYSLDDTNYASVGGEGILKTDGGFGFTLPACSIRWRMTANNPSDSTVTLSVENV